METEGLALQCAKRLTKSSVEHIPKNPLYYGDFLWNGKLYHGSHPPIISHDLWEQTQEAFHKTNRPKTDETGFCLRRDAHLCFLWVLHHRKGEEGQVYLLPLHWQPWAVSEAGSEAGDPGREAWGSYPGD
jgi:hypothetical protein